MEEQFDPEIRTIIVEPPRRRRGSSVSFIIAVNVVVFFLWHLPVYVSEQFMKDNFLVSWESLVSGRPWTLLGSVFSHFIFIHILFNMVALKSFGTVMEIVIGWHRFLSFYLIAGIFSSFCHAVVSAWILGDPELQALGASGAVSGVVLLFSLMFPKEKILILGIIPVPALWGALAFVGLDVWGLISQAEGGGLPLGHGAHLGGALAGAIYFLFFIRNREAH